MNKVVNTYLMQSTALVLLLTLIATAYLWLRGDGVQMAGPLGIVVVFQLVACWAYGLVWKSVVSSSTASLPTFYLAASGFRMFVAIVVVMAFLFMNEDKQVIRFFVIAFLFFYFLILIYDTLFFVKVEKKIQKKG